MYADIQGVVNSGNMPVEGAEIHIKNHFDPGGFRIGEDLGEGVTIGFTAVTHGNYSIDLYRLGSEEPFAKIMEDSLATGEYSYLVPDTLVTNGIYIYTISSPLSQPAQSNFLINKPDSALAATRPIMTTGPDGTFMIDADYLAIDQTFFRGANERFSITDSLQIIVVKDGEIVGRNYLEVSEEVNFVEINLN